MPINLLVVFLLALMAYTARADTLRSNAMADCVSEAAERSGLSGSVVITHGGERVVSLYQGRLAGTESPMIGASTRFNLASASKMFTAVGIGQLIQAGKLHLDQPIGDFVHGLTVAASRVTIRQLLNHTSGLGNFFRPENMQAMVRARDAEDLVPLIAEEKPGFLPGSRFQYSNSGFALLGAAIEHATGLTYGEYLRHHIFMPAGMTDSGLDPKPLATLAVGMTAMPIISNPRNPAPAGNPAEPVHPAPGATDGYGSPAGGLFSTGRDMIRFAAALSSGKLLPRGLFETFTSPQADAPGGQQYGFGFMLVQDGHHVWAGHNGGTLGANSEFFFEPKSGWVVSVLANRDPPAATRMMRFARHLIDTPDRPLDCSGLQRFLRQSTGIP